MTEDDKALGNTEQSSYDAESSASGTGTPLQNGVSKVEALATAWGKKGLYLAYFGLFLGSIITSLEQATTFVFTPAATSAFGLHHVLSTVGVVSSVMLATVKPPVAKIADVFGRTEALVLSLVLSILGYVMKAAARNVHTFAASQIFGAAGSTGLIIFTQIFVADTTTLLNRALFSSLPDIPYLFTTWIGPYLANAIGAEDNWRWGYGMWAILVPASFLPMVGSLVHAEIKAKRMKILPPSPYTGQSAGQIALNVWNECDIFGLILLSIGLIMVLVPLTLTGTSGQWSWTEAKTLVLIIVGVLTLVFFVVWEDSKYCKRPMFAWKLFKDPTMGGACLLAFFYFFVFYLPNAYFYTWQQVVRNSSTKEAGNISNIFIFSSTTMSIIVSLAIKRTGNYKWFMMAGIPIYVLGYGLMILFRSANSTNVQIIFAQIFTGLGGGAINVPAQVGLQAAAGHAHVAMATAMFLTMISVGGAVGNAVTGSIWSNLLPGKLEQNLAGTDAARNASDIYANYFNALKFAVGTPERDAINASYAEVYRIQLIVACCLAVPMIPLGLWMKNLDLKEMEARGDTGVKGYVVGAAKDPIVPVTEEGAAGKGYGSTLA